jgi:hypothetical protein
MPKNLRYLTRLDLGFRTHKKDLCGELRRADESSSQVGCALRPKPRWPAADQPVGHRWARQKVGIDQNRLRRVHDLEKTISGNENNYYCRVHCND